MALSGRETTTKLRVFFIYATLTDTKKPSVFVDRRYREKKSRKMTDFGKKKLSDRDAVFTSSQALKT